MLPKLYAGSLEHLRRLLTVLEPVVELYEGFPHPATSIVIK